jgi:hypothetical protein
MIPVATYGRRDSRVTFDFPYPFAAMNARGARNGEQMREGEGGKRGNEEP